MTEETDTSTLPDEGPEPSVMEQVDTVLQEFKGSESDENTEEDVSAEATESLKTEDTGSDQKNEDSNLDEDGIPTDVDALRQGFLRQADYTRKTQDLARQRKEIEVHLQEVEKLKAQYQEALNDKQPSAEQSQDDEPPKDLTSAADLLKWYVKKEVEKAKKEFEPDLEPVRNLRKQSEFENTMADAWVSVLNEEKTDVVFNTKSAANLVGTIIESDKDLVDIAHSKPKVAIRTAMKLAKEQIAKRKKEIQRSKQGTDPLKPSAGRVSRESLEDPMEVAAKAIKELRKAETS